MQTSSPKAAEINLSVTGSSAGCCHQQKGCLMKMKHNRVPLSSGEQSGPTETTVFRWLAAAGTIVTPAWVAFIAHYEFGLSRQEIRTPALAGAAIIGVLLATEYVVAKLRKSGSTKSHDRSQAVAVKCCNRLVCMRAWEIPDILQKMLLYSLSVAERKLFDDCRKLRNDIAHGRRQRLH